MRRFVHAFLALFVVSFLALAIWRSPDARASVIYTSPYTYEQTFGTAMRMLRVDMGFTIKEQDRELGYILFEYTSPESSGRITNGSIELVDGKAGVVCSVQLPSMPTYHERMMIDSLAKKLVHEHGNPPIAQKPKPPAPDAGADGDGEAP